MGSVLPYQRAIKLHLLLDHDGYLPSFACVTEGKVHEIRMVRQMRFDPGTIVVFDRGYTDYERFAKLHEQGVFWPRGSRTMLTTWWWRSASCPTTSFVEMKSSA